MRPSPVCLFGLIAVGLLTVTRADQAKPVPPPAGAKLLFDGKELSGWTNPRWKLVDDAMEVFAGSNTLKEAIGGDFHLHVEFWLPLMPGAKEQSRANSGIFPQGDLFEIQVLDSYMNPTYKSGGCGAIYGQKDPDDFDKAVKPPEQWNSFDIHFTAAKFENGAVKQRARVTVFWNGVKIHNDVEIVQLPTNDQPQRLSLQDHGNKVRYRNIWLAGAVSGKSSAAGGLR